MPVHGIQTKITVTLTEDGTPVGTVTKSHSVVMKQKERQDLIVTNSTTKTLAFTIGTTNVDFLFVHSDIAITVQHTITGQTGTKTSIPIPAGGFTVIQDFVPSSTQIDLVVPAGPDAGVIIIAGDRL